MEKCQIGTGRLPEDEYMIVGTKEGLQHLIEHCETALSKGNSTFEKSCEFEGIKLVKDDYFKEKEENHSLLSNILEIMFIALFLGSLIVGFITIVKWLLSW